MSGCHVWQQNYLFGHPWLSLRIGLSERFPGNSGINRRLPASHF
jgi:hypothetical protein